MHQIFAENQKTKLIVRIRGGLGNQLFTYAAARRLSLVNNAELVIDDVTGFIRDLKYRRRYALEHFHIPCRKATPAERLEPLERYRRGAMKWLSHRRPFAERRYVEQEGLDFDERLIALRINGVLYLDGLWQSEQYFKDVEQTIREELRIVPPTDEMNQRMAEEICSSNAIALHVRWFDMSGTSGAMNLSTYYYHRAIALIEEKIDSPRYFLFSDSPEAARALLALPENKVTIVSHNRGDENAYADLWLMSQCQHFITAKSTFSWWGAWLGKRNGKIVLTPCSENDGLTAWGFKGLIPGNWVKL